MDTWRAFKADTHVRVVYNTAGQTARKRTETTGRFNSISDTALSLYFVKYGKMRIDFTVPLEHIATVSETEVVGGAPPTPKTTGRSTAATASATSAAATSVAATSDAAKMTAAMAALEARIQQHQADTKNVLAAYRSDTQTALTTTAKATHEQLAGHGRGVQTHVSECAQKLAAADERARKLQAEVLQKSAKTDMAVVKLTSDLAALQTGMTRLAKLEQTVGLVHTRINKIVTHIGAQQNG